MKKMWSFKTANFTVTWLIEDDDLYLDFMDKETAEECREKVQSGEWQCFNSVIRVEHRQTRTVLAESFLGNSIYANPNDFRDHFGMIPKGHGSYFSDMVREALAEARECFNKLQHEILVCKLRSPTSIMEAV